MRSPSAKAIHLATMVAAGGLAVLVACAKPSPTPEKVTKPTHPTIDSTLRDEILSLESDVRRWRVELGLKPQPVSHAPSNGRAKEVCEGLTECKDPCNLAGAICQNADRICDIAREDGSDWARDKCRDAKRSCEEAREVCGCCERRQQNGLLRSQPCAPPPSIPEAPEPAPTD